MKSSDVFNRRIKSGDRHHPELKIHKEVEPQKSFVHKQGDVTEQKMHQPVADETLFPIRGILTFAHQIGDLNDAKYKSQLANWFKGRDISVQFIGNEGVLFKLNNPFPYNSSICKLAVANVSDWVIVAPGTVYVLLDEEYQKFENNE